MTPQLTLVPRRATGSSGTAHLTEDQFGELLSQPARTDGAALTSAEAHLLACDQCAAELTGLRESLSLFREASNNYADHELRRLPPISLPARSVFSPALTPMYWATAAALFLAAILPMQSLRQHTLQSAPTVAVAVSESASQSDEALLADIDRDTSASVPSPMQALADPTASTSSTGITALASNSNQRKD